MYCCLFLLTPAVVDSSNDHPLYDAGNRRPSLLAEMTACVRVVTLRARSTAEV
jgi:hypothetical protein